MVESRGKKGNQINLFSALNLNYSKCQKRS